jgi:hypothetical protein
MTEFDYESCFTLTYDEEDNGQETIWNSRLPRLEPSPDITHISHEPSIKYDKFSFEKTSEFRILTKPVDISFKELEYVFKEHDDEITQMICATYEDLLHRIMPFVESYRQQRNERKERWNEYQRQYRRQKHNAQLNQSN